MFFFILFIFSFNNFNNFPISFTENYLNYNWIKMNKIDWIFYQKIKYRMNIFFFFLSLLNERKKIHYLSLIQYIIYFLISCCCCCCSCRYCCCYYFLFPFFFRKHPFLNRFSGPLRRRCSSPQRPSRNRSSFTGIPLLRESLSHGHPRITGYLLRLFCGLSIRPNSSFLLRWF